jgi:hypothetical protein
MAMIEEDARGMLNFRCADMLRGLPDVSSALGLIFQGSFTGLFFEEF